MKWPVFVVPALAGIRPKSRLKAELRTAHFRPREYNVESSAARPPPDPLPEGEGD